MNDRKYDKYFGFTFNKTKQLCEKQNVVTFEELISWYDGYKTCSGLDVFNPGSVVYALSDGICQSNWTNTGPMDEIIYYINNDIYFVKNDIVKMISGIPLEIKLKRYGAERKELNTRNQILSAMTVHDFELS